MPNKLTRPSSKELETLPLTPVVGSLLGILRNANLDEEDYRRHLEARESGRNENSPEAEQEPDATG
jgi:hypothetical protein